MWDEEDGFFYDVLRVPGQFTTRLKVRSIVGLLPLCAVSVYRPEVVAKLPRFIERVQWFNKNRPELLANINQPGRQGAGGRLMLSLLDDDKLRRVLARMLDPTSSWATTASARSPAITGPPLRLLHGGAGVSRRLPARRIGHRHVRRQLELARPDLGADQRPVHSRPDAAVRFYGDDSRSSARPAPAST